MREVDKETGRSKVKTTSEYQTRKTGCLEEVMLEPGLTGLTGRFNVQSNCKQADGRNYPGVWGA